MENQSFEETDGKLVQGLKSVREKKIPEGLLNHFSSEIEDKIRSRQKRFSWFMIGAPAFAVLLLVSLVSFKTPGLLPSGPTSGSSIELAQVDSREIAEEMAALEALDSDDLSAEDVDEEILALLDEIA